MLTYRQSELTSKISKVVGYIAGFGSFILGLIPLALSGIGKMGPLIALIHAHKFLLVAKSLFLFAAIIPIPTIFIGIGAFVASVLVLAIGFSLYNGACSLFKYLKENFSPSRHDQHYNKERLNQSRQPAVAKGAQPVIYSETSQMGRNIGQNEEMFSALGIQIGTPVATPINAPKLELM